MNQEKSLIVVDCSCVITQGISSAQRCGVVSSSLLAISESSHTKKRPIKSMFNYNGPKTELF